LTPQQQRHLDDLIARLTKRTERSKNLARDYRPVLADNRATAGFRLLWKEMQYPLFVERGKGSRLWDVDGNEYIDLAMGFGALLFGHSPSFIIEALDEQIRRGIQLGGSSPLAAKAAKVICELTGAERVSFCNSGTEAVMSALRLARTVTGRTKIAVFEGAYHGTFDGVMVRGERIESGKLRAIPLAPGVPQHMIDNVILLDPDDPSCGDVLKANGRDLAAVLLEPLQNRRPDMQPGTFLKQIRQTTKEIGSALIFDEVVSGFRFHPGGAQAVFGVQADLVTYGKAVGAGMPVGVVAGKASFMDAIDGGMWSYGDDSYPRAETTFFAGTYFKHPLVMAAVWASLKHMKESGPRLQERLNEQTKELVDSLNAYFNKADVPMRVAHFASLFRFMFPRELNFTDIFYYHMLEQGIYICETRNCLYSTAHTVEDAELILAAVQRSVTQMREGGFFGESHTSPPDNKFLKDEPTKITPVANGSAALLTRTSSDGGRVIPLTEAQQGIWSMAHLGGEASCAYNQFFSLRLRGIFDLKAMRGAIADLVDRHEALRIRIKPGGEYQQVQPNLKIEVPLLDLSAIPPERHDAHVSELLRAESHHAFDLIEGPLVRASVMRLGEHLHVLCLVIHHIVTDGWSNGILLNDLTALYSARCQGVASQLPAPGKYSEFVALEAAPHEGSGEDEGYWLDRFADKVPIFELPTDHSRPPQKTFKAARERLAVSDSLYEGLKRVSAQQRCTLFMTLIAGFSVMLHKFSEQDDIVVGITAAGQLAAGGKNVVGYCINLLPIRSRLIGDPTFAAYLMEMKQTVLDAYKHQRYPFRRLLRKLNPPRDPSRMPLISVSFNLDKTRAAGLMTSADAAPQARVGNLEVEFLPNPLVFIQWELFFNMIEAEDSLLLECDYNADLFNVQTVRRWMQAYLGLLEAAVARPLSSIGALGRTLAESNSRWRLIEEKTLEEARVKKFDKLRRRSG
jgi:glutamate-1-semialdehyde aminotransferase